MSFWIWTIVVSFLVVCFLFYLSLLETHGNVPMDFYLAHQWCDRKIFRSLRTLSITWTTTKTVFFYLSNENWLHNRFEDIPWHIRFSCNLNSSNVPKLYLVWHNLYSQSMHAFDDASQGNILHRAYYCTATEYIVKILQYLSFGSKPDYFM